MIDDGGWSKVDKSFQQTLMESAFIAVCTFHQLCSHHCTVPSETITEGSVS